MHATSLVENYMEIIVLILRLRRKLMVTEIN